MNSRARYVHLALGAAALATFGCRPRVTPRGIDVVVVAAGSEAQVALVERSVRAASVELPVSVRIERAPEPRDEGASAAREAQPAITRARAAFVRAHFTECIEQLSDEAPLRALFAEGARAEAAVWLYWRMACQFADERTAEARATARRLAVSELGAPTVVARADIEEFLAAVQSEAAREPRATLRVESSEPTLDLRVDGRESRCATPCALHLAAGPHVLVASAPARASRSEQLDLPAEGRTLAVALESASPDAAAREWSSRRNTSAEFAESGLGLRTLATALRARRLAYLTAVGPGRLRGALVVDESVASRAVTERGPAEAPALLLELLQRGSVVAAPTPIVRRPEFWAAVIGATGAAVGITAWALTRPVRTTVLLGGEGP